MKKILCITCLAIICISLAGIMRNKEKGIFTEGTKDVLRLHILANSDAEYDQALKLKVKSVVAETVAEDMKRENVTDKEEAMEFMQKYNDRYIALAKEVIHKEGYDYDVSATLGRHWFPVKTYGQTLYPEGEYDAYRLLIGSAQGKNWWCVLFPSLCMVDEACYVDDTQALKNSKLQNAESQVASEANTELQNTSEINKAPEKNDIQIRFRIVEWFKEMW